MDWNSILQIGLGRLQLMPSVLWSLSPMEFLILSGLETSGDRCTRKDLNALLKQYPDDEGELK